MRIDRQQIIDLLKSQGKDDHADQAQSDLPDQVDPEQHADLLARFGINPTDLLGKIPGLGGFGG
ncbi:hypothetical protein [Arthrobacter bussei]|jgi:hypothetical protein|uniref:Uncharacterized protein n=1 Tax=Arthrobacter bussei TaxID=2594179 RepID=A0A7X1NS67_9MICC|nr:hypothetical protein [Arthrobacter bussei]MPY11913.1 hypothetical protein [Arthrobacter bussei]